MRSDAQERAFILGADLYHAAIYGVMIEIMVAKVLGIFLILLKASRPNLLAESAAVAR